MPWVSGGRVEFGEPKTAAGRRVIALDSGLTKTLEDYLDSFVSAEVTALVFTTPDGEPLHRGRFRKVWARASRSAGAGGLNFHDLRHTGLTLAGQAGATLAELGHLAGHADAKAVARYQHSEMARQRAIADRVAEARLEAADYPTVVAIARP